MSHQSPENYQTLYQINIKEDCNFKDIAWLVLNARAIFTKQSLLFEGRLEDLKKCSTTCNPVLDEEFGLQLKWDWNHNSDNVSIIPAGTVLSFQSDKSPPAKVVEAFQIVLKHKFNY